MPKNYKQWKLEEQAQKATAKLIQDLLAKKKTVVVVNPLDDQFDRLGGNEDVLDIGTNLFTY